MKEDNPFEAYLKITLWNESWKVMIAQAKERELQSLHQLAIDGLDTTDALEFADRKWNVIFAFQDQYRAVVGQALRMHWTEEEMQELVEVFETYPIMVKFFANQPKLTEDIMDPSLAIDAMIAKSVGQQMWDDVEWVSPVWLIRMVELGVIEVTKDELKAVKRKI